MSTSSHLILFFLFCCISNNVLGLISEYKCRNSLSYCKLLVKTTPKACLNPWYQWRCPEECGVCKAKCKDFFEGCLDKSYFCLQRNIQNECRKTCASCDVCEDLISSKLCHNYKGRCKNDIRVRYACRKTCGLCKDDCNDAILNEILCFTFERKGYCSSLRFSDFMKRGCRHTCGFCYLEQC